jgi:hypothetical protein
MALNRGAEIARENMGKRGDRARAARELEIPPGMISRFLSGDRLPNPRQRAYFEDNWRVGWRTWDAPPEQPPEAA